MPKVSDIDVLKNLPKVNVSGKDLDKLYTVKFYKGKFVLTEDGHFIAKILPKTDYDKTKFFHDDMLAELGVKNPESTAVKHFVTGGGKIEFELIDDYSECRLYGSSTVYGDYDANAIDLAELETALEAQFHLGMMPILVVPDFQAER